MDEMSDYERTIGEGEIQRRAILLMLRKVHSVAA